jgi:hypothetical protein
MNITRDVSGVPVSQRVVDGYINATAMTTAYRKATGQRKDVADWLRNKRTQETLKHLNSNTGIPVFELHQVFEGSPELGGGTWLHPKLSVRFAMWLSDDFGFQVESWVEQWMTTAQNPVVPQSVSTSAELPVIMPTEQELAYMRSRAWEKAEMMGVQVPVKIKKGVGYRRAIDIVRELTEAAQCDVISW